MELVGLYSYYCLFFSYFHLFILFIFYTTIPFCRRKS
jgi:hypothetical protein